jgi:hypothetical protein
VVEAPFALQPCGFSERLISWNGLAAAGFAAWEFLPGMGFGDRAAWWRGGADRGSAHEGLDLRCYRTADGRRLCLGAGSRVPALWPGQVAAVVDDFLGRSVFVAHRAADAAGRRLHSVFGHVVPAPGLAPGAALGGEGEVGLIAPGRGAAPAHLHLTVALVAAGTRLDWAALGDPGRAQLLDPLPLLCGTMPPLGRG